ncbi:hypothetical protein GGI12_002807 [Dipsacomyces acuminosporus]|nr:hypothetical protein GGI12_002807 [Dipsacomyces acuminosporus]
MFSPLKDALKKLRESKQAQQPPPAKRTATASDEATTFQKRQQPAAVETDNTADDLMEMGFDMEGLDDDGMIDDLLVDDLVDSLETITPTKPSSAATNARIQNNSSLGLTSSARTGESHHTPFSQRSIQTSQRQQPHSGGHSQHSQSDLFTTPRAVQDKANTRLNEQVKNITTTVVANKSGQRIPSLVGKRQELPGPAGLIGEAQSNGVTLTQKRDSPFKTPLSRRTRNEQSSDVDFEGGTWAAMLDHLKMPAYKPSTEKQVTRTVEAAAWPVRRILDLMRAQKIEIVLVQLREVVSSDMDASAVVVDPTGEMRASIHKAVMQRFAHFLSVGCSIILRGVVALKLPSAQPFLVITADCIDQIFTTKGNGTHDDPIILSASQATAAATPVSIPDTPSHAPRKQPRHTLQRSSHAPEQSIPPFSPDELEIIESQPEVIDDGEALQPTSNATQPSAKSGSPGPVEDDGMDVFGDADNINDNDLDSFLDILDPSD